ncbi:MAG: hypothetical protein PF961_06060 [Planctomycetota bacterium]|nr:hypothetical protein [Planctomycetota bacterium]
MNTLSIYLTATLLGLIGGCGVGVAAELLLGIVLGGVVPRKGLIVLAVLAGCGFCAAVIVGTIALHG